MLILEQISDPFIMNDYDFRMVPFRPVSVFALKGRNVRSKLPSSALDEVPRDPHVYNEAERAHTKVELAIADLFDSEIDDMVPGLNDTRHFLSNTRYAPVKFPEDIQHPKTYASESFIKEIREKVPDLWAVPCDRATTRCRVIIPVIIDIYLWRNRRNKIALIWKTYCPFCDRIRIRRRLAVREVPSYMLR